MPREEPENARRRVAFEEIAGDFLRYLDNSEDLEVNVTELQEQQGKLEEAGISIKEVTQQARNENSQFLGGGIFRQGEEEVCIASWALPELEKGVRI